MWTWTWLSLPRARREQESEQEITHLSATKAKWSTEVLRKTTLGPGQAIGGQVVFPVSSSSGYLVLSVVTEGECNEIPITQERIETARKRPRRAEGPTPE